MFIFCPMKRDPFKYAGDMLTVDRHRALAQMLHMGIERDGA